MAKCPTMVDSGVRPVCSVGLFAFLYTNWHHIHDNDTTQRKYDTVSAECTIAKYADLLITCPLC